MCAGVLVALFAALLVTSGAAVAQEIPCDEFDTGSKKWDKCLEEYTNSQFEESREDAQEENQRNGVACAEFNVGTPEWTDCIEGAATGGGLMPWIVIVPLGVMLVGMGVMFTYQASNRGMTERRRTPGLMAGNWLIFMAFIEGAVGAGMVVADSRASGGGISGFKLAAYPLIGIAVIMLVVGIVLRAKSKAKARLLDTGIQGRAKVIDVQQTGTVVNNIPRLAFTLEVTSPVSQRVTVHSSPPILALSRLHAGMELPIRADQSLTKVEIDWDAWVAESASGGQQPPSGYSGFGVQPDYTS
jgi:hypothetical protein